MLKKKELKPKNSRIGQSELAERTGGERPRPLSAKVGYICNSPGSENQDFLPKKSRNFWTVNRKDNSSPRRRNFREAAFWSKNKNFTDSGSTII